VKFSFKKIVSVSAMLLLSAAVISAVFFGSFVRGYYPDFSTMLFISSAIFFGGIAFAIVERNIVIGILTLFLTMIIPFISTRMEGYWQCLRTLFSF